MSMKRLIKSNRGSLSVEAIISLSLFLMLMSIMAISLNIIRIYDTMEHCVYTTADKVAVQSVYGYLSHREGVVEMQMRPVLFKGYLCESMAENGLETITSDRPHADVSNLKVEELSVSDFQAGASSYRVLYSVPVWPGYTPISLSHEVRVRSVLQNPVLADEETIRVYTSKHGRANGIYHLDPMCWALKSSWNTKNSVEVSDLRTLVNYRACRICGSDQAD